MSLLRFPPFVEEALRPGPLADVLGLTALGLMVYGFVETIRTRSWVPRVALVAGCLLWPLPEHPLLGPVIVSLSYAHGVHLMDLLSLSVVVAALPRRRSRHGRRASAG